jgi:hypothetical protein
MTTPPNPPSPAENRIDAFRRFQEAMRATGRPPMPDGANPNLIPPPAELPVVEDDEEPPIDEQVRELLGRFAWPPSVRRLFEGKGDAPRWTGGPTMLNLREPGRRMPDGPPTVADTQALSSTPPAIPVAMEAPVGVSSAPATPPPSSRDPRPPSVPTQLGAMATHAIVAVLQWVGNGVIAAGSFIWRRTMRVPSNDTPARREPSGAASAADYADEDARRRARMKAEYGAIRRALPVPAWARLMLVIALTGASMGGLFFTAAWAGLIPPPSGTLRITAAPTDVAVFVDGQTCGVAPVTLTVAPGGHKVELVRGSITQALDVQVTVDKVTTHYVEFPQANRRSRRARR